MSQAAETANMEDVEVHESEVTLDNKDRRILWPADDVGKHGGPAPQDELEMIDSDDSDDETDEDEDRGIHHEDEQQTPPTASQSDSDMVDADISDDEADEEEEQVVSPAPSNDSNMDDDDEEEDDEEEEEDDDDAAASAKSPNVTLTTGANQQAAYTHLPRLPAGLKIPKATYHRGSAKSWDNVNLEPFASLSNVELLCGVVHPDDLCGTLMLELVKHFTHTQIKNRINELRARLKKPELKSQAITKRWTLPLMEEYPDKTQFNAKKAEIKGIRSSLRHGTHAWPDFPASAQIKTTTSTLAIAASASPTESSATPQDHANDQSDEDAVPPPSGSNKAKPMAKKAKAQKDPEAHDITRAKITILEKQNFLDEESIRKKEEQVAKRKEKIRKLEESLEE